MFCYTVGHSNHSLGDFRYLLLAGDVNYIIDVRSVPYSGYVRHFNREVLAPCLERDCIGYQWFGRELGGNNFPPRLACHWQRVDAGLAAVCRIIRQGYRVALMCTEKDPLECHRFLALTPALAQQGIEVRHILGNGEVATTPELEQKLVAAYFGPYQFNIFEVPPSPREMLSEAYRRRFAEVYRAV